MSSGGFQHIEKLAVTPCLVCWLWLGFVVGCGDVIRCAWLSKQNCAKNRVMIFESRGQYISCIGCYILLLFALGIMMVVVWFSKPQPLSHTSRLLLTLLLDVFLNLPRKWFNSMTFVHSGQDIGDRHGMATTNTESLLALKTRDQLLLHQLISSIASAESSVPLPIKSPPSRIEWMTATRRRWRNSVTG